LKIERPEIYKQTIEDFRVTKVIKRESFQSLNSSFGYLSITSGRVDV